MKKRVLSALLAICLTLSLAGAAFAENEPSGDSSSAVSQAVSSVESEPQTQNETVSSGSASGEDQTTAKTESTPAPTETPAASDVTEEEPESTVAPEATEEPEATATPDATPAPTEDPVADVTENEESDGSVEYTASLETDGETMNVIVTAPEGAFAEGVQPKLSVTMLTAEDELNTVAGELDAAEVQYDGFAALDITFTDGATGMEVEPVKSVAVRIELPQAIVDSGIDLTTLAVQHLEEDADGNVTNVAQVATLDNGITLSEEAAAAVNEAAGVAPMNDMPAEEATAGDATETPAAVAEFSVDGFSSFTITWQVPSGSSVDQSHVQKLTVECRKIDESKIDEAPENFTVNSGDEIIFDASNEKLLIEGYTFDHAEYYSSNGWERLEKLSAIAKKKTLIVTRYKWSYTINDEFSQETPPTIRLYYKKDLLSSSNLYIDDQVVLKGKMVPTFKDPSTDNAQKAVNYKWYKSNDENGAYTEVVRKKVTLDSYNVTETGDALYPSYDEGAQQWYYVEAYDAEGNKLETSDPFQVPFYDELQNGSFEKPVLPNFGQRDPNYQSGEEGMIWRTTAADKEIELIRVDKRDWRQEDSKTWGVYGLATTADGDQVAELNANSAGALYQDVLTMPGSTLSWQLSHRARNRGNGQDYTGQDTMYVIIMSAERADSYTQQAQIESLVDQYKLYLTNGDNSYFDTATGIGIWKITDGATWVEHTGRYVVPSEQYVTRFFFASGETAFDKKSNNSKLKNTVGNFIDDVSFGQNIPDPNDDEINLTLSKTVVGLTDAELENYKVEVKVTGEGCNQTVTFNKSNLVFNADGTSATGTVQIQIKLPANTDERTYIIEESVSGLVDGKEATSSAVSVDGKPSGTTSTSVTAKGGSKHTIAFTNTYTQSTGTLTLKKSVVLSTSLNSDDQNEANRVIFEFKVTAPKEAVGKIAYSGAQGETDIVFVGDGDNAVATVPVSGINPVVIENLPLGEYKIEEVNRPSEILEGKYYFDETLTGNGAAKTITLGTTGTEAEIKNTYAPYYTVTITKQVGGEMGSNADTFTFTSDEINLSIQTNITIPDASKTTLTSTGFTMKAGGSLTVNKVKKNTAFEIVETAAPGYNTEVKVEGATNKATADAPTTAEFEVGSQNVTVTYQNNRKAVAPTGLEDNHTKPFGLMVGVAVMAGLALAGGAVVRRRRRWME